MFIGLYDLIACNYYAYGFFFMQNQYSVIGKYLKYTNYVHVDFTSVYTF